MDVDEPLALRKVPRSRHLRKRYEDAALALTARRPRPRTDVLPERLAGLPPTGLEDIEPPANQVDSETPPTSTREPTQFLSPKNSFGLYRRYTGSTLPSHDPNTRVDLEQLMDSDEGSSGERVASIEGLFPCALFLARIYQLKQVQSQHKRLRSSAIR